jgi:hypothetical protein
VQGRKTSDVITNTYFYGYLDYVLDIHARFLPWPCTASSVVVARCDPNHFLHLPYRIVVYRSSEIFELRDVDCCVGLVQICTM